MFPKGFSSYVKRLKANGKSPNKNLSRFAARYKLAKQLKFNAFDSRSELNSSMYTSALRIALAVGAMESLQAYLGKRKIALKNIKLADYYRLKNLEGLRQHLETESAASLRGELQKLASSAGDSNLTPVILALRHSMLHGQFSPSASKLTGENGLIFLLKIEGLIFSSMDEISSTIFDRIQ